MQVKVLLVEDDADLAATAVQVLEFERYRVTHADSVDGALMALQDGLRPDAAVLDINIGSHHVFVVADYLDSAGVPFFFASAFDPEKIPARFAGRYLLQKPYTLEGLLNGLRGLTHLADARICLSDGSTA
jgi:DNA-binding response OmpR family regulator